MSEYGVNTRVLIEGALDRGAQHVVALIRHSARTFGATENDLDNQLTEEGREYARQLGAGLPKQMTLRGYASPVQRCIETAEIMLAGHRSEGGRITRNRTLEALGVFYVLDQPRMWMSLDQCDLATFMRDWAEGRISPAIMIPADTAAGILLEVLADKLSSPPDKPQLDICITHDMTVHLLCEQLLGLRFDTPKVKFLDGLIAYRMDDQLWFESVFGERQAVLTPGKSPI